MNKIIKLTDSEKLKAFELLMDGIIFTMARTLSKDDVDYFWGCKRKATDDKEVLVTIEKLATNVETIRNAFKGE